MRGLLCAFAKVGRVLLGHYQVKWCAGIMIGLGAVASIAGGAGVPMIIAGVTLLCLSTALSISDLEQRNPKTVLLHVVDSLCIGAIGIGTAFLPVESTAVGIQIACSLAVFASCIPPIVSDIGYTPTYLVAPLIRKVAHLIPVPDTPTSRAIRQAIDQHLPDLKTNEGLQLNGKFFHLDLEGGDCITATPFKLAEKRAWCLLKAGNNYSFILAETADRLLNTGQGSHPYTKEKLGADHIIRGQDVLDLLAPAAGLASFGAAAAAPGN